MPDDSDLSHQIAQRAHGDRIRAERAVMDLFGRSRSEVREWMHRETNRIQDQQAIDLTKRASPEPLSLKISETRTQSHGDLTKGESHPVAFVPGAAGGAASAVGPLLVTGCVNGVPSSWTSAVYTSPVAL